MLIKKLEQKQLIHPPNWLSTNTHYLTIMGSQAYGCNSPDSDFDIYGFCIPNKEMLFPHLAGEILDFGTQKKRFHQWTEAHIVDKEELKEYDFSVYSIVRFFQLCLENNPNMLDALFTPQNCVIHSTHVGNIVRDNRHAFLHKGCYHKFRGYAFSQIKKMKDKNPEPGSKRAKYIEEYGYDMKYGLHLVRLLGEVEQILTLHDLDLQRDKEVYKSIKRGEWKEQDIYDYFDSKEKTLEVVYNESKLPWGPDEPKIKQLLLDCLESHYGSLDKAIVVEGKELTVLRKIQELCEQVL
jgi:uncharacterized protein